MKDYLRPALKIILAFTVAALLINEVGSIIWANYQSGEVARLVAEGAATQYRATQSQPLAGQAAVQIGADRGVTVYGFQVKSGDLTVWIKAPPVRTPLVMFLEWLGTRWETAKGWHDGMISSLTVDTNYTTQVPQIQR